MPIILPWKPINMWRGGAGGAPAEVKFSTTETGSVSVGFRGTNGKSVFVDAGDGTPLEEIALLGISTPCPWNHDYSGLPGIKYIGVYGDLIDVLLFTISNIEISGYLSNFRALKNCLYAYLWNSAGLTGDWSQLEFISPIEIYLSNSGITGNINIINRWPTLGVLYLNNTDMTYTTPDEGLTTRSGDNLQMDSCGLDSSEVDQFLIDAAAASWSSNTIALAGTNEVRTSESDDALIALVLLGNAITVNE